MSCPGFCFDMQVDPLGPKPRANDLLETYKALQAAEKEVTQAIRDSEWEGRQISRTRNNQEQSISLETPYYDIVRIQVSFEKGAKMAGLY